VRKILIPAAAMAVFSVAACERTGDGQYEVDRPVVGTERDTVTFPQVETGTITDTVDVPTIRTEEREIQRPTIRVDP
jgi:hypothetical protein